MNTELFIVTYAKDFPYLEWCLKSISKFARGFHKLRVLIPTGDRDAMTVLLSGVAQTHPLPFPICISLFDEWPGKGMLHHELQILRSDEWCPTADIIAHIDSDCVFTEPVTPDDYVENGKPLLRYEPFARIGQRHPGVLLWREYTQKCLPFQIDNETMRCHPEVYHKKLYDTTRRIMEAKLGKSCEEYIREQRNEFPQTFCEFNTLGNVAMALYPHDYKLIEQFNDTVTPYNKLQQFWGHGPLDKPQDIWVRGKETSVVPIDMIHALKIP